MAKVLAFLHPNHGEPEDHIHKEDQSRIDLSLNGVHPKRERKSGV